MSRLIPITRGFVATVDDDDYEYLMQWKWRLKLEKHTAYAKRQINWTINGRRLQREVLMHRELIGISGYQVDHINRNGLDNRRCNLRLTTASQNMQNRKSWGKSGYRGVRWHKTAFVSEITINKKKTHLGSFQDKVQAARAYDEAALKCFGEFAQVNFKE